MIEWSFLRIKIFQRKEKCFLPRNVFGILNIKTFSWLKLFVRKKDGIFNRRNITITNFPPIGYVTCGMNSTRHVLVIIITCYYAFPLLLLPQSNFYLCACVRVTSSCALNISNLAWQSNQDSGILKSDALYDLKIHVFKLYKWYVILQSITYEDWLRIPWRIVTFTKLKVTLLHRCFDVF